MTFSMLLFFVVILALTILVFVFAALGLRVMPGAVMVRGVSMIVGATSIFASSGVRLHFNSSRCLVNAFAPPDFCAD